MRFLGLCNYTPTFQILKSPLYTHTDWQDLSACLESQFIYSWLAAIWRGQTLGLQTGKCGSYYEFIIRFWQDRCHQITTCLWTTLGLDMRLLPLFQLWSFLCLLFLLFSLCELSRKCFCYTKCSLLLPCIFTIDLKLEAALYTMFFVCIVSFIARTTLRSSRSMKLTTLVGWLQNTSRRKLFMEVCSNCFES